MLNEQWPEETLNKTRTNWKQLTLNRKKTGKNLMSRDNGMNAMSAVSRDQWQREMEIWELTATDTSQTNKLPSYSERTRHVHPVVVLADSPLPRELLSNNNETSQSTTSNPCRQSCLLFICASWTIHCYFIKVLLSPSKWNWMTTLKLCTNDVCFVKL